MEKEMTTKEKIIFESLKLFYEKGYEGVSMREIASAVGIKGASIYNHFKGYDVDIMALHFYSPIYYILCKLDLGASYE